MECLIPLAWETLRPFSPDGSRFAAIRGGDLQVWDTANWSVIHNLGKATYPLLFSPDGAFLTARDGDSIKVWLMESLKSWELKPQVPQVPYRSLITWDISPRGNLLAQSSQPDQDGIYLWKLPELTSFTRLESGGAAALTFSPSGEFLATQLEDHKVQLWNVESRRMTAEFNLTEHVVHMQFSPDGRFLAAASVQLIYIWSVPALERIQVLRGHVNEVFHLSFSPDGKTLASAGQEKRVLFWDVPTDQRTEVAPSGPRPPKLDSFRGGVQRLASTEEGGLVQFWKVAGQSLVRDFRLDLSALDHAATVFSDDGRLAAVGRTNGVVDILECQSGRRLRTIRVHDSRVDADCLSPDQRWLVVYAGKRWRLVDLESEKEIASFESPETRASALHNSFSPDSRLLAYAGPDWTFRLWDLAAKRELAVLKGHSWLPYSCNFSPDGKFLATSSWDGEARIWYVALGKLHLPPLTGHVRGISRTEFSADSRILLTSGDDETVRLWSVATGQEMVLIPDFGWVMLADNDNALVLGAGHDDTVKLVKVPSLAEIQEAESRKK